MRKYNTEIFIEKAKLIHGDKYDYSLVDYKGSKIKIKIKCNKCGTIFEQVPASHLQGVGCRKCKSKENSEKQKTTISKFVEKSKAVHGDKYDYSLVNYINCDTKVKIKCNKCCNIFEQTPYVHVNLKCGCPKCNTTRRTTEQFIEESKLIHGDKYDYSLVDYKSIWKNVKIICKKHGVFEQIPHNHLEGKGCRKCKSSKGENIIEAFLKHKNINYIPQYRIGKLSYDFYVTDYNLFIEYNGGQHYTFVKYFHKTIHDFHRQLHHDWLKRKYAKTNNIKLLVIPYWEYENIEKILEELL